MSEPVPINELAGHNRPPLAELIEEEIADARDRAQALIGAAADARIANDDDAAKVADLIVLIRAHEKHLDEARETRKKPFLEGSRTVDRVFGGIIDPLIIARAGADRKTGGLSGLLTAWDNRRREEARRERERLEAAAQRQREEAAAHARAAEEAARTGGPGAVLAELKAIEANTAADMLAVKAAAAAPQPIRTSISAVSSRREHEFEITDLVKVLAWLRKTYESPLRQAVRTIVGAHLRSQGVAAIERALQQPGRELIPGVEVRLAARAQVRR